jgi:NAD(P)-dependent dehydrogenase (short-subunit alcohol dehydrogenase family)
MSSKVLTVVKGRGLRCDDHHFRPEENSMTALDLTGRTALVTGGAQGLGEGMAQALAAAGARVVVADLQDDLGEKVADSLEGDGHGFVHLDVTDESSWENAVTAATSDFGGLDVLVNNAGVEISSLIVDVDPKDIRTMLEVNVLGTALGLKWGLRAMRPDGVAGKGGSIINISSVAATIAFPGIPIYSATKSAVDRMTRVAAMEAGKLGYGVRVNCVYPGLVPTAMGQGLAVDMAKLGLFASPEEAVGAVVELTPSGRLGEVADMADAVVFLASDNARFVNGVGLPVDGGMGM